MLKKNSKKCQPLNLDSANLAADLHSQYLHDCVQPVYTQLISLASHTKSAQNLESQQLRECFTTQSLQSQH